MWIMIAGPYASGAKTEDDRNANLFKLNLAAVEVLRRGHTPIIGVNMALPMIEAAGKASYSEIMMPVSLELAKRCDAILRVDGASEGADREVALMRERGGKVYFSIEDIPQE